MTLSARDGNLQQIENINHLVFSVVANKPGSIPGEAVIVIEFTGKVKQLLCVKVMTVQQGLTNNLTHEQPYLTDLSDTVILGFEKASYLGTINSNIATIESIVLSEGYTEAVTFTLEGGKQTSY